MNMRWTNTICLLLLLLLSAGMAIQPVTAESSVTLQMDLTPPAIDYTGTVTINGNPAPVGTEITAYVGDQEKGSTKLSQEGTFDLTDALAVQGTRNDIDQDITFSVTEVDGTTTTTSESKTYYPSDDTVLDINIGETAQDDTGADVSDTRVDDTDETMPPDESTGESTEPEPAAPPLVPGIFAPLGTSQVIITEVIQQVLAPISQIREIAVPIAMAIERVEAITGLAIFDNFLAFLLIGFVSILFLILVVSRRDHETDEERKARLRAHSSLLAKQNRSKK